MSPRKRHGYRDEDLPEVGLPDELDDDFVLDEGAPEDGESTTDLATVYQASSLREAKMMKSILEAAEITALIGESEANLANAPPLEGVPVLVSSEMVNEAEEVLAEAAMSADEDLDETDFDDEEPWHPEPDEEDEDIFDDEEFNEFEDEDEEEEEETEEDEEF